MNHLLSIFPDSRGREPFTNSGRFSVASLKASPNTPVSWSQNGNVVSRYKDDRWDYTSWVGFDFSLIFRSDRKATPPQDVGFIKAITVIALFAVPHIESIRTVSYIVETLRRTSDYCQAKGYNLHDLSSQPGLFDDLVMEEGIARELRSSCLTVFSYAWLHRDEVGFECLRPDQIERLREVDWRKAKQQTPYIPSRLYDSMIDACINQVDAYNDNSESLAILHSALAYRYDEARKEGGDHRFQTGRKRGGFYNFATKFGAWKIIEKLTPLSKDDSVLRYKTAITSVRKAGVILLQAHSFMRFAEALTLRCGALHEDFHASIGHILYLRGMIGKRQGRTGVWTTSEYSRRVFEALRHINMTHLSYAEQSEERDYWLAKFEEMPLFASLPERWSKDSRHPYVAYSGALHIIFPGRRLCSPSGRKQMLGAEFLSERMVISDNDLSEALRVTPSLPRDKFFVGGVWPLATHQLRRSGLVRAAVSGMVSHPSLTFQAKHTKTQMTAYYHRNFLEQAAWHAPKDSLVKELADLLDPTIKKEFLREEFEGLKVAMTDLKENKGRFFSPYGEEYRDNLLSDIRILSEKEFKQLSYKGIVRKTLLGACLKSGFCEYGTARSVKGCVFKQQGSPCAQAIVDSSKRDSLLQHVEDIKNDLELLSDDPREALIKEAWEADLEAAKAAVSLIDKHEGNADACK